jgi:hypothetical protein
MDQLNKVQTKNAKFVAIMEGLNEMKLWIKNNPDASLELLRMTEWERNLNYTRLENYQQAKENLENELKNSLAICTRLHKTTFILNHKVQLPQIEEIGKPKSGE